MFGDPDYYFQTYGPDLQVNDGYAWNHGGAPEVNTTFLGIVGPGVKVAGVENDIFTAFQGHHISDSRADALISAANALAEYVYSLAGGDE